jgi:flagellar hook protein FlgE
VAGPTTRPTPGGLTQLSDSFAPVSISKNGSPVGNMTSVEVDPNGNVRASFDNGMSRLIYKVPLADVPNPNGLQTQDNQSYTVTPDSGPFFELTQLIQTQRAYSSNAKVIQTVDEMLQETTNIKR